MVVVHSDLLSNSAGVSVIINNTETLAVSELTYEQNINAARKVQFKVDSLEEALKCSIGSKVVILVGRVPPNNYTVAIGTYNWGQGYAHYYHFEGVIRKVMPTARGAMVTAGDYISLLNTSAFVEYKEKDVIGQDLFILAADAANITEIDTTNLLGGCGITATKEMALTGLKTRKEFMDLCFANMLSIATDATKYHDAINPKYWQYNIRHGKVMDFFELDPSNVHIKPAVKVTLDSNNAYNLTPVIDTQRLVNSITIENSMVGFHYTYTDTSSVSQYGVNSLLVTTTSTRREKIETAAFELVSRFNKPSIKYNIELPNTEVFSIGDYVEASMPLLGTQVLPIQSINVNFNTGKTILTAGEKALSIPELVKRLV